MLQHIALTVNDSEEIEFFFYILFGTKAVICLKLKKFNIEYKKPFFKKILLLTIPTIK